VGGWGEGAVGYDPSAGLALGGPPGGTLLSLLHRQLSWTGHGRGAARPCSAAKAAAAVGSEEGRVAHPQILPQHPTKPPPPLPLPTPLGAGPIPPHYTFGQPPDFLTSWRAPTAGWRAQGPGPGGPGVSWAPPVCRLSTGGTPPPARRREGQAANGHAPAEACGGSEEEGRGGKGRGRGVRRGEEGVHPGRTGGVPGAFPWTPGCCASGTPWVGPAQPPPGAPPQESAQEGSGQRPNACQGGHQEHQPQ